MDAQHAQQELGAEHRSLLRSHRVLQLLLESAARGERSLHYDQINDEQQHLHEAKEKLHPRSQTSNSMEVVIVATTRVVWS